MNMLKVAPNDQHLYLQEKELCDTDTLAASGVYANDTILLKIDETFDFAVC
jgi:hypothetical protein